MTWRHYLRVKTRDPAWLWRMAIAILGAGVIVGVIVDSALTGWLNPLKLLPANPHSSGWTRLERLAEDGQWAELWWGIPRVLSGRWRATGLVGLAALTGLAWLAFVLQAVQIRAWRDSRLWICLAGAALGVLSIWPTIFFIFWQEHGWDLNDSQELTAGLTYNILGIGLREEAAKFICLTPLLPWLVSRRDELAALLASACVGLGFAMEENIGYITATSGSATLARLLTPAPFHMAMTALVGLAAYRACLWPRQWIPQLVATFGVVVLAHGVYDAFLSLPDLIEYAIVAQIIFVLLVYQFFRELRPLQALRTEPISLSANFLFCVCVVAAATFVYVSAAIGWREAADVLAMGIVGQSVMVYLFLREMPETMVRT